MPRVFLSYSRKDLAFVERLTKDLEAAGLEVWYDLTGLEAGTHWGTEIQSAIEQSQFFIAVLSPHSVKSEWVEREFLFASNQNLKIIPILGEECKLPLWSLNLHYIDMQGQNYRARFPELMKALGAQADAAESRRKEGAAAGQMPQEREVGKGKTDAKKPPRKGALLAVWLGVPALAILTALILWGLPALKSRGGGFIGNPIETPPVSETVYPIPTLPPGVDCLKNDIFCVGFVTDSDGISDPYKPETQEWRGIQRAEAELGVHVVMVQPESAGEYEPVLGAFASQGYDLVIAANYALGEAVARVAEQYPDVNFLVYDMTYPSTLVPEGITGRNECIPNASGEKYKVDQAAYLAGYLAAGITEVRDPQDPKLGIFGGANIPGVTTFNVGFQAGMDAYNAAHDTIVTLLGWSNQTGNGSFTNTFSDPYEAKQLAETLADDGADILLPVSYPYQSAALEVAALRGLLVIGVDTDGYDGFGEAKSALLTSIRKRSDNAAYDMIASVTFWNFRGCTNYIGEIANGGVDIAPFHDLDSQVPPELKAELVELEKQIRYGQLKDTGCISYPQWCTEDLYPTP